MKKENQLNDLFKLQQDLQQRLNNYHFKMNPNEKIIIINGFKTNVDYALEELKWYYAATNNINFSSIIEKTWKRFSDDDKTVNSAYGYRMFKDMFDDNRHQHIPVNQWRWCIDKLKDDKDSRQAVINLNLPSDKIGKTKDFVCTMYFQIFIRDNKLIWITNMRSNDIYFGLRNDIYCFMSMQCRMANELNISLGDYYHNAGSLHIYEPQFYKLEELFK